MGNTGIALAKDGAAPFLNPATTVGIEDSRLAFSVHFYSLTITQFDGFHAPRGGGDLKDQTLTDVKLSALPTTFCLFINAGSLRTEKEGRRKLTFCVGTSERRDLEISDSRTGTAPDGSQVLHSASIERSYGRVHVGPTYAAALNEHWWLGASAHLVDTHTSSITIGNSTAFGAATNIARSFSSQVSATSFDLAATLGAVYRVDRATTIGVGITPPTIHIAGGIDAADSSQESNFALSRQATGKFSAPIPMRVGLGIGTKTPAWTLEANATLFFPTADSFTSTVDTTTVTTTGANALTQSATNKVTTRGNYVFDSAIGGEYFLSNSLSMLAGAALDFPATPPLRDNPPLGTMATTRETRLTTSFGIGSYAGGGELLFGFQFGLARGETFVADNFRSPSVMTPIDQRSAELLFVIAGSTSFNKILRTVDEIQKTTLPPKNPGAPGGPDKK